MNNSQAQDALRRIPMSERTHARAAGIDAAWIDCDPMPDDLDADLAQSLAELYEETLHDPSQPDALQEFTLQVLRRLGFTEVETLLRGYAREAE